MQFIEVRTKARVGTIALNHYAKRNALSKPLIEECLETLTEFTAAKLRAVVLRSASVQKVWSAGHDVDDLPEARAISA